MKEVAALEVLQHHGPEDALRLAVGQCTHRGIITRPANGVFRAAWRIEAEMRGRADPAPGLNEPGRTLLRENRIIGHLWVWLASKVESHRDLTVPLESVSRFKF